MALLCHQMAKSWHQGKQAVLLITKGQIKSVKGNFFFQLFPVNFERAISFST